VKEHKEGMVKRFTSKYLIDSLAYYEEGNNVNEAIFRKKEIKARRREKKAKLIESINPDWEDVSKEWFS